MRGTMAVFLAGGRGEGLGVLSEHRAPAAVPFAGKYRLVDFSLSNCHHSEVFHVALLTQHAPTSLNEHIRAGRPWDLNRDSGGVRTLHPFAWRQRAAWYEGPTDALLRNLNEYEELGAQRVVVGSAEHVYLMDYSQLVQSHLEARCPITAAVTPAVPARAWRARGVEVRGERVRALVPRRERGGPAGDGRATRAAASPSFEAMGVFVFEMDFLRTLSGDTLPRTLYDLTASMLEHGVPVHAYGFDGFWEDLDDLATYYRTSMAIGTLSVPMSKRL